MRDKGLLHLHFTRGTKRKLRQFSFPFLPPQSLCLRWWHGGKKEAQVWLMGRQIWELGYRHPCLQWHWYGYSNTDIDSVTLMVGPNCYAKGAERATRWQNELYSRFCELFSKSSVGIPALLPCSLLPRQARVTLKKLFTKPHCTVLLVAYYSPTNEPT